MARKVISITFDRPGFDRQSHVGRSSSNAATALMSQLLGCRMVRGCSAAKPDAELVPLASALLQSRLSWDRTVGPELSGDPVWSLLLLVYQRQAMSSGLGVGSLVDLDEIAPATVLLRWTAKLVSDGVLELAEETALEGEAVIRLTAGALNRFESWLRTTKEGFEAPV